MSAFRKVAAGVAGAVLVYVASAYFVLPRVWTHYDARSGGTLRPMVTVTLQGRPGDPINVGIIASQGDLARAMGKAGWFPADPVTLLSSLRIVASVLFDRSYTDAPVSPLLYEGRPEDLAFEKPVGISADRREHVRFWQAPTVDGSDRPLWLGSVTFDHSVGLSHYTGAVTHDIAPDIDTARNQFVADLQAGGEVADVAEETGIGPTTDGRNGEGSPYHTDGMAKIVTLRDGADQARGPSPSIIAVISTRAASIAASSRERMTSSVE
ncbi:LssY C-terminal domain-containing protein [Aureimonas sp. AU12]|uniref:LssY C-terminal domain-containing protein n=1 Tax=Aureimonas sp. AU12 TaxID=1638161 RepID=UPI0009E93637|nr:LssY C-terminal domain-containing protein [Aureimonas sp. AU12]